MLDLALRPKLILPAPAILRAVDPWKIETNRKLIEAGLDARMRREVISAIERIIAGSSKFIKCEMDMLLDWAGVTKLGMFVTTQLAGFGAKSRGSGTFPTVRSVEGNFNNSAAASNSVTLPTGTTEGDRVVIIYSLQNNSTATITHPAGWTVLVNNQLTGASQGPCSVVYRDIQAGDGNPSFGVSSSTWRAAWVAICFNSGTFDTATAPSTNSAADSGSSTTVTPASIGDASWYPYATYLMVYGSWIHNVSVSAEPTNFTQLAEGKGTTATGATVHASYYSGTTPYYGSAASPNPYTIASTSRFTSGIIQLKGI